MGRRPDGASLLGPLREWRDASKIARAKNQGRMRDGVVGVGRVVLGGALDQPSVDWSRVFSKHGLHFRATSFDHLPHALSYLSARQVQEWGAEHLPGRSTEHAAEHIAATLTTQDTEELLGKPQEVRIAGFSNGRIGGREQLASVSVAVEPVGEQAGYPELLFDEYDLARSGYVKGPVPTRLAMTIDVGYVWPDQFGEGRELAWRLPRAAKEIRGILPDTPFWLGELAVVRPVVPVDMAARYPGVPLV